MVYLSRIYTKSGDAGQTSLGNGDRVSKTHPRISAYGMVDELNSSLGLAISIGGMSAESCSRLKHIQNDLFDVGADLCVPESHESPEFLPLRVIESQVTQLEQWIDAETAELTPLKSFILPGGTAAAALLHLARTVCRRSEIAALQLIEVEQINPQVLIYLNRLSDLLFVMARRENAGGTADILWTPGGQR